MPTTRQIFYRLVGSLGYEKTEQANERLGEHLSRARRAGVIAWDAIRDDGGTVGDHDASGVHMFLAFLEDVKAFTRELPGETDFTRLAVTPRQITRYRLPTARTFCGGNSRRLKRPALTGSHTRACSNESL